MAFRTKKISQMDPKGANLASTDLLEISQLVSGSYVTKSITGAEIVASVPPSVTAWGTITGTLSAQTDLNTALSGKVPTTRTLTINGTTQDLSADRTFTISTATPTLDQVTTAGNTTTNRITIGGTTTNGSVTASGLIGRGNFFNNTLVASANNDVLVGLDIQPTFTNGAFTGVENIPLRFVSQVNSTIVKSILLKNTGSGAGSGVSIGFNNLNANNLSHAFIKSYYTSGMAMSFGTGGGAGLTTEGTTALILNADQTATFSAKVTATTGGFQAGGTNTNLLMSDGGTPVITRNGGTGIQFLKDSYWQTFSIFTNNAENLRVASTGNVLINTTTDAGFKLDVNGTARVLTTTVNGGNGGANTLNVSNGSNFGLSIWGYGNNPIIASFNSITIGRYTTGIAQGATSSNTMYFDLSGQKASVGNSGLLNSIAFSAVFEVQSTNKGFMPPRMTTTQKNAIATPDAGLQIYDSTLNRPCFYDGTSWITL
jgi:hypothetical protein